MASVNDRVGVPKASDKQAVSSLTLSLPCHFFSGLVRRAGGSKNINSLV